MNLEAIRTRVNVVASALIALAAHEISSSKYLAPPPGRPILESCLFKQKAFIQNCSQSVFFVI